MTKKLERPELIVTGTALISDCTLYRYRLARDWEVGLRCLFIMLNPSTADALANDPTIRRCIGYAQRWGFAALDVGNIFALRSTNPKKLYTAIDPIGPNNDYHLLELARSAERVVVAWGRHGSLNGRGVWVLKMLRGAGVKPLCFGLTENGHPKHPLYQKNDAELLLVPGGVS